MALDPVVNFFQSEIATLPVASGGTSIVISSGDGAKLPDPAVDGAYNLTIYEEGNPFSLPEIVRVTTRSSDTLTVTRAQEGTTATTKTAGTTWKVVMFPTAKTIQDIDTAKLDVADVVNNLTSTDTDKALSANQGKVLQDGKEPADATILKQANIVDNLTSTSTTAPLSANQGKVLQDGKLNLSGGTMTGDLTIPDKIIHSGDTNTAIRFPANDTVTVETGGVERMRVDSNGNVGINKSPANFSGIAFTKFIDIANVLQVRNPSGDTIALIQLGGDTFRKATILSPAGTDDPYLSFGISNNGSTSSSTERMRITSAGNVGIGTTSPATALDVNGAIRTSTGILFGADTAAANTLDDYEEGTWTPTINTGGFTSLTIDRATYTKIGNRVYVIAQATLVGTGNASAFQLAGLPFAVIANGWAGGSNFFQKLNTEFDIISPLAFSGTSVMNFQIVDTNGDGGLAIGSDFGAGYINFSFIYETT